MIESYCMDYETSFTKEQLDLAINKFILIASHKILSPLTVIKWTTELLEQEQTLSPSSIEKIKAIDENVKNLENFAHVILSISDLRNNYSHNEGAYEIDINKVINKILSHYEGLIKTKNLVVKYANTEGKKLLFSVDDKFLSEILKNVFENAFFYTEANGNIEINTMFSENEFKIDIIDDGIGIPEIERPLLFDAFFRGANALKLGVKGNGLGLYYVKLIMDRINGTIVYAPKGEKGSVFTLKFPVKLSYE